MSGDYSRFTNKPGKRFSGVYMQQGRVQLDADWNEEIDILKRRWETQAMDTFGRAAVPKMTTPNGFKVVSLNPVAVGVGRMYVDGLLAERLDTDEYYSNLALSPEPVAPAARQQAVVYLDVFEREVTYIEDPELIEPALGGPDTTTRTQVVWQVKVQTVPAASCGLALSTIAPASAGRLSSRAIVPPASSDPCVLPPTGNYRGLENRLYRVEVHQGGPIGTATFKWSRENASIVSQVTKIDGPRITVTRLGRDKVLRFQKADWVEVTDDVLELAGSPGKMAKVVDFDEANQILVLDRDLSTYFKAAELERHTRVRRWDQKKKVNVDGLVVTTGNWIALEDGIEVQIISTHGYLKTVDAWSFAARAVDGTVEELTNEPPRVVRHHYVQLASWDGTQLHDCRRLWPEECCCCTVVVGDGVTSHGEFNDIGEAYAAAVSRCPDNQIPIRICLLPGTHRPPQTVVLQRQRVTVSGCGRATRVEAPASGSIFQITGDFVRLENLYLTSSSSSNRSPLVHAPSASDTEIESCIFQGFYCPLLVCELAFQLSVVRNAFRGDGGIYVQGFSVLIAQNEFQALEWTPDTVENGLINLFSPLSRASVIENQISSGFRHGIVLYPSISSTMTGVPLLVNTGMMSDVLIARNRLAPLSGTGITISAFANGVATPGASGDPGGIGATAPIFITGLRIEGNKIKDCAWGPWERPDGSPQGAIVVGGIEHLEITDNHIERNGIFESDSRSQPPIAAIYVGHARGMILRDNVVLKNGGAPSLRGVPPQFSDGGIVALDLEASQEDGWPAAMVHGNLVTTPRGRALTLIGMGPMQVTDNRLVSDELFVNPREREMGYVGAVLIENGASFTPGWTQGPVGASTPPSERRWTDDGTQLFLRENVIFSDNEIYLHRVLPSPVADQRQFVVLILTAGDLGFHDNLVRCGLQNLSWGGNTFLGGGTLRATGNGIFEDPIANFSFESLSVFALGPAPTLSTVTNNQTTHCINAPTTSASSVFTDNLQQFCDWDRTVQLDPKPILADAEVTRRTMLGRIAGDARAEAAAWRAPQPEPAGEKPREALPSLNPEARAQAAERIAEQLESGLRVAERAKEIQPSDDRPEALELRPGQPSAPPPPLPSGAPAPEAREEKQEEAKPRKAKPKARTGRRK